MRKITATIQARMGSSRLPGKVLKEICGKPMLQLMVERLTLSQMIDRIIIATTTEPEDNGIAALAEKIGVGCFRGSEDDVLGRVVGALKQFDVDIHVEFQGDNVMPDPQLVDNMIGYYLKYQDEIDYLSNGLKTTFPPGQEVAVYPASALLNAEEDWQKENPREHVGIHIYKRPDKFKIKSITAPAWYHYPHYHLEVDTQEDFEVVKAVYEHFYEENQGFTLSEIIAFLKSSGITEKNSGVERRWKSFRDDTD
jgi:spore coat polysaccharide biosynthesis protein SpsF